MQDYLSGEAGDIRYIIDRRSKRALRYRLQRRGSEIVQRLRLYCPSASRVLDVGVAEGGMLLHIMADCPGIRCFGVDICFTLLSHFEDALDDIPRAQADACYLPFRKDRFDVVIAAALIEHVADVDLFARSVWRTLKGGGIWIFTTPDPFWDKIATVMGHLGHGHDITYDRDDLVRVCERNGFEVVEYRKFMISPVGVPGEVKVENLLRKAGFHFLMANQLVVARRAGGRGERL